MKPIKFDRDQTKAMVGEIQDYFRLELDQTIGPMPAELLMHFFAEKMGAYYYNQALHDAQELLRRQLEGMSDALYALEQPTKNPR